MLDPLASAVTITRPLEQASLVQREPYRLFFAQGILLGLAGTGHWVLHAAGVFEDYRSIFHAMTQVQGFLMSFAIGFLFTMIPSRTGSHPPAKWQIAVGVIAPIGTTIAAWFGQWPLSQVFFVVLAFTLVSFIVARVRPSMSTRRPPDSFVWLPFALLMGIGGSVMTAVGAALGTDYWWLHTVGRGLVLQGMFVGLVLGVGGLAIPLMTRGAKPSDASSTNRSRAVRATHVACAAALILSFFMVQWTSLRAAMLVRAVITAGVLIFGAEIWRRPTRPGWARWMIWVSAWCVPIGFALAALFDDNHKAGLHVVFIGGFATLTLGVSTHVTLAHGGYAKLRDGRPWVVPVMAACLVAGLGFRVAMEFDKPRFFEWMGVGASCFVAALIAWLVYLGPKLRRDAPTGS